MRKNPGHLPLECEILDENDEVVGFRPVHVRLFNGWSSAAANSPPWPSAGRYPLTVWRISKPPHPFEIEHYEVATT